METEQKTNDQTNVCTNADILWKDAAFFSAGKEFF
jgi:hypothetical protein